MSNFEKSYKMTCHQAQLLMVAVWAKDVSVTEQDKSAFDAHIAICSACRSEYAETCRLMAVVKEHWGPISKDTLELIEKAGKAYKPKMTVEEGWQELCRRCPDLAENAEKPKKHQLLLRIGAAAACLAVGLLAWITFSIYSKPQVAPKAITRQAAFSPKASVTIELVSKNGNILIPANQQIASNGELKTIIINGRHQLMMNTNTVLIVEPLVENSNIGCQVKLVSGRIYTNVLHDGNPFIVDTAHGQAVITGTAFDVKVTDGSTTLIVSEGTVQFGSKEGIVNVAAGQISKIAGQFAPSIPASCNTVELTAWATGYKGETVLAQGESDSGTLDELPWPAAGSIDLERTDYGCWIREKRNWFRLQFPHVFQLKDALSKEGIEADYPQLLIQAGNLWQFAYIKGQPDRFSVVSFDSLLKTASDYGFDKQWLLENVAMAGSAQQKPALSQNTLTVLKAFEQWQSSFEDAQKSLDLVDYDEQYFLFHASVYLTETKSLLWFAVSDGQYDLTAKERAEVLTLLQSEVNAAGICRENALHQPYKNKLLCDPEICKEEKWCKWADAITENIKAIISAEEKIAEYELGRGD